MVVTMIEGAKTISMEKEQQCYNTKNDNEIKMITTIPTMMTMTMM